MLNADIREDIYERWVEDGYVPYSLFSLRLFTLHGEQWFLNLGECGVERARHELKNLELAIVSGLTTEIAEAAGFQLSQEFVYGSEAYAGDWQYQEYMNMDEEEQFYYHQRFG